MALTHQKHGRSCLRKLRNLSSPLWPLQQQRQVLREALAINGKEKRGIVGGSGAVSLHSITSCPGGPQKPGSHRSDPGPPPIPLKLEEEVNRKLFFPRPASCVE